MNSSCSSSSSVACIATEYLPSISGVISIWMNCSGRVARASPPAGMSKDIRQSPSYSAGPRGIQGAACKPEAFKKYTPVSAVHKRWGTGKGYNNTMDVETRARGRLFERPEEPRPFRMTQRDLSLLENLARLRLASGEQLAGPAGGGAA